MGNVTKVFMIIIFIVLVLVSLLYARPRTITGGGRRKVHFNKTRRERWFDKGSGEILVNRSGRT